LLRISSEIHSLFIVPIILSRFQRYLGRSELVSISDVANLTVAVFQQPNGGMFQVTVLSGSNSTVPEVVPDQTALSNIPQKTQRSLCALTELLRKK
jgi:hypothetical protein